METIRKLYRSEANVLGFVAVAAFSLTLPCTRLGIPFFGAAGVSVARAALGGLGAVVILLVQRAPFPPARDLRDLAIVAATSVIGFPALAAFAMGRAPASHGAVVRALVPLLTALIGSRLSAERLPARFLVGGGFGRAVV